jgi:hypothetical protein
MKPRGLLEQFARGRAPELHQVLGVFTQNNAVLGLNVMDARRINDRIYTGPRAAVQRYGASPNAADVVRTPYGSA